MHFWLYQIYFWLGSVAFGALYVKSFRFAQTHDGVVSGRLRVLTTIFAAISLAWIVCEIPYVLLQLFQYPIWLSSGCNDVFTNGCNRNFCQNLELGLDLVNTLTLAIQNCFTLINTLLLISLMPALQKRVNALAKRAAKCLSVGKPEQK